MRCPEYFSKVSSCGQQSILHFFKCLVVYVMLHFFLYVGWCMFSIHPFTTLPSRNNYCRWEPSTGFTWHFEAKDDDEDDEEFATSAAQRRRKRRRRILDNRPPGARTEEEEEGIRASEAIDSILVRLSKSDVVVNGKTRAIKPKSEADKDKK